MGFFSNVSPQERAINTQIQQTHAQINELYTDLGRYVKLNLKDKLADEQYVQNSAKNIDDCLARLQQLNKDLIGARGNKLCIKCSAEIPMAVSFCPSCGTQQPPVMGMGGAPMNNGMNGGMPMNNGGAQPGFNQRPAFTPGGAGNSPSNPNRNMAPGANNAQPVQAPVAPMPPMNDIPTVPPVPTAAPAAAPAPTAPAAPEMTQAPAAEPITETTITNDDPVTTAAPVISDTPAAPAAAAAESFVFCSQCGHKEPSGVAFCSQCGAKL